MLLAVVDTNFPLLLSGFRYWENYEFHKIDGSILFFSVHKMTDRFPAEVHPLETIRKFPITDIYCIFLNHTLGLLDCPLEIAGKQNYGISKLIADRNISIHTTIYPGGGFEENFKNQALEGLQFLKKHPNVKTVFTNLSEVKKVIPEARCIVNGNTNTEFYRFTPRTRSERLQILFAATCREEKGFKYLAEAWKSLDPTKYHLNIVGAGDWKSKLKWIKHLNYSYHGTLPMHGLRDVYNRCHIAINPSYKGHIPVYKSSLVNLTRSMPIRTRFLHTTVRPITLDGFPTVMCQDAMSTGCCLVSTNPRKDYLALKPGEDYIEIGEKQPDAIADAIENLYGDQDKMLSIARNGRLKMEEHFDTRKIARLKYNIIKEQNND